VDGWDGADRRELAAWLQKVRERIVPRFDITPEILTHTRALDLATGQLLPESEHDWSRRQDEPTLTGYIAAALGILQRVGLDANGVTSPCDFGRGNEDAYARAVLAAQRQVCKRQSTWYFLHTDTEPAGKTTQVYCRDGDAWVVSVVSKAGDYLWQSMETQDTGEAFVQAMADKHLSAEGATGQFALLRAANQPIVFHTHWQSLYANGRYSGLRALELVCARIERAWRGNVAWTRCSDLAAAVAGQERQT
jgi:hypothetical protein